MRLAWLCFVLSFVVACKQPNTSGTVDLASADSSSALDLARDGSGPSGDGGGGADGGPGDNLPPTLTLTSPQAGAPIVRGQNIALAGTVADSDGTVVELAVRVRAADGAVYFFTIPPTATFGQQIQACQTRPEGAAPRDRQPLQEVLRTFGPVRVVDLEGRTVRELTATTAATPPIHARCEELATPALQGVAHAGQH